VRRRRHGGYENQPDHLRSFRRGSSKFPERDSSEFLEPTDIKVEPNDDFYRARDIGFSLQLDGSAPTVADLSICPAGAGDVDFFRVTQTDSGWLVAMIAYELDYGDLDVAIFTADGARLSADATVQHNGCAAAFTSSGVYYIAISGASASQANRYNLRLKLVSQRPANCPPT
jgi:hypothetical protein